MADEVKNGLSADPSRIASQWNRSTVADGSWLQKYTLSPLTARDYYLASAIDALGSATDDTTSALSAAISSVSAIHDEYINYISATISGDISGYIDYISGSVDSLSSEFKTSANAISSKLDNEIQRATEVEEVLQSQINLINASTDVINVYGSYGGENGFNVESAYYFDPAKTATYHLTNNDIIKIINDEYTPVEETGQTTTGHQTYYQWINNEGITGDPQRPSDGSWNFIGYTEPYYNIAEVNNKFTDISATVANNYLSASTDAVSAGKNIIVTKEDGPVVGIKTKDDVSFTSVSATGFSGTNLSGASKNDSIDNLFGSAYSGAAASAWVSANSARLDIQAGYGLETGENDGHLVIGLHQDHCDYYGNSLALGSYSTANGDNSYAFGMSCDTKGSNALAIGDNACATTGAIALGTYNSAMGKYSLALGYNTSAFNQFSVAIGRGLSGEAPITLGTWNDNVAGATFIIGDGTGTQEGHDVVRKNALVIKDGLVSGRDFSAGNVSLSSLTNISAFGNGITNTATFNLSAVKLSAGQGISFKNDTNGILSISAEGRAYTGENYVKVDNTTKKIGLSGNLVGSAESGQSAYDWITTKSATLQAGQGIGFYSAGQNILGISAEGTTYQAGDYISTANKTIAVTGNLITSAEAGSAASAWVNTNKTKIAYSADFKGSSNVITGYGTSSFAGGISSISVGNTVFTGRNVILSAGDNIDFTTGDNKLTIDLYKNITLGENAATQIWLITETEDQTQKSSIVINDTYQSQLQLSNDKIIRNGTTTWDKVISASNGNFVSAYNQPITIATATTLPAPASMVNGVYYIV